MSYESLNLQVNDMALRARVESALQQEARVNPVLSLTEIAGYIRQGIFTGMLEMIWDVSIDTEEAYKYALDSGNPNPGGDDTVITDGAILSAVQVHWPSDPS